MVHLQKGPELTNVSDDSELLLAEIAEQQFDKQKSRSSN